MKVTTRWIPVSAPKEQTTQEILANMTPGTAFRVNVSAKVYIKIFKGAVCLDDGEKHDHEWFGSATIKVLPNAVVVTNE